MLYSLLPQTLPEDVNGPKWQQDWGLIGKNPGVRLDRVIAGPSLQHSSFFQS